MDEKAAFVNRMRAGNRPAWRWDRAGDLVRDNADPDHFDDADTVAAWRLRQIATLGRDVEKTSATPAVNAALVTAYQIYESNGPVRWEIEARVLAGESQETIAQKCRIEGSIVERYEAIFFDVRDHLGAGEWLMEQAVGMCPRSGRSPSEGQTWRYCGLVGGPLLVDLLTAEFYERPEPVLWNRTSLVAKARYIAGEAATGYSSEDSRNVIQGFRELFVIPAGPRGSAARKAKAGTIASLRMLLDLQTRAQRGNELERRKALAAKKQENALTVAQLNGRKKRRRHQPKAEPSAPATDGMSPLADDVGDTGRPCVEPVSVDSD